MPKVSIVTINRNNAIGLSKTIESVITQNYYDFEYIIIDGASEDSSVDVIKKFVDNITIWISEPDKGIYDAMNKAIDLVTGEWICFMNSGDTFYDTNVLKEVFYEREVGQYDVIYGDIVVISKLFTFELLAEALDTMIIDKPFSHQSCFVKSKLHKINKFDTTYRICADYAFFLDLYNKKGKFKYLNLIVGCFDSRNSMSVNQGEIVISEHCRLKKIKEKSFTIYINKSKVKFKRCFLLIFDFISTHSFILRSIRKSRLQRKVNIGWVQETNDER